MKKAYTGTELYQELYLKCPQPLRGDLKRLVTDYGYQSGRNGDRREFEEIWQAAKPVVEQWCSEQMSMELAGLPDDLIAKLL